MENKNILQQTKPRTNCYQIANKMCGKSGWWIKKPPTHHLWLKLEMFVLGFSFTACGVVGIHHRCWCGRSGGRKRVWKDTCVQRMLGRREQHFKKRAAFQESRVIGVLTTGGPYNKCMQISRGFLIKHQYFCQRIISDQNAGPWWLPPSPPCYNCFCCRHVSIWIAVRCRKMT